MNAYTAGAIVPRSTIAHVAQAREIGLNKMNSAIEALAQAQDLVNDAFKAGLGAHRGHADAIHDKSPLHSLTRPALDLDKLRAAYRHHLDKGIWKFLIDHSGMGDMMDRQAKDEIRATFTGDVPEATEENMAATLETLFGQIDHIAARGIAQAFSNLDRRFKSHNGFKVGSRIIIDRLCSEHGWMNYGGARDTLADVERAFAMVAKEPPQMGQLESALRDERRNRGPHQSEHETRYFKIRIFKNGNAHLWFSDDALVKTVNKVIAEWYGPLLPDAAPKTESKGGFTRKAGLPSKDLQFYPTPPAVAEILCDGLRLNDAEVLEPSAGTGAICKLALQKGARVTAVEIHELRAAQLETIPGKMRVICENFLTITPSPRFSHVLMNPPFYGTHWMEHVYKAWEFIVPGGTLRAILPASAEVDEDREHLAFRRWVESQVKDKWMRRYFRDLPSGSFKSSGTNIETVMLDMTKPR